MNLVQQEQKSQDPDIPGTSGENNKPRNFRVKSPGKTVSVFLVLFVLIIGTAAAVYLRNTTNKPENSSRTNTETQKNATDPDGDTKKPTITDIKGIDVVKLLQIELPEKFATYEAYPINGTPKVPAYSINSNLDGITNKEDFTLSDQAKKVLVDNLFVVVPGDNKEFFSIYERNGYSQSPSFVTTDAMLHNYHLMFNHILETIEEERLAAVLNYLNKSMLNESQAHYEKLKGTDWENAAKRNIGYFAVADSLLDPNSVVPDLVKNEVQNELSLIEKHEGPSEAPVMNMGAAPDTYIQTPQGSLPLEKLKEDYSQYIPRGHYEKSDLLKAYFKSMMWHGRLTFRFKNEDEIRSALLITLALEQEKNDKAWNLLYEPINFFVGESDDITYRQLKKAVKDTYGDSATIESVTADQDKFAYFVEEVKNLPEPKINSMVVFEAQFQPDREREITGFRFLGQRFTIDASIFQRLIYREVGDKTTACQDFDPKQTGCLNGARCLPKGLDIPATLGSDEAVTILGGMGETKYACYPDNMNKTKSYITNLPTDTWKENLYWNWMYSLLPLTDGRSSGYPSFMANNAWSRKELNTFLGSWTELKHDTILYAKQAYAEMGGGSSEEDFRGYVEPNPHLYSRLASLVKMTKDGLAARQFSDENTNNQLDTMFDLAISLKTISEKELNNENLTDQEHMLIKSFGGQIEHIWSDIFDANVISDDNSAPLVADVATDPNSKVLEEATGYIYEIYVVVPVDNKLRIARGGVYSYYEFSWPLEDRLTDSKWKGMLNGGEAPDRPAWTDSFIAE